MRAFACLDQDLIRQQANINKRKAHRHVEQGRLAHWRTARAREPVSEPWPNSTDFASNRKGPRFLYHEPVVKVNQPLRERMSISWLSERASILNLYSQ